MSTTEGIQSAVVLLSGGIDSAVVLALAKSKHEKVFPLVFDYGQKHIKEIKSAYAIANHFGIEPTLVKLSVPIKSRLLQKSEEDISSKENYVPFRNTIFLSIALACAETYHADTVYYGANDLDVEDYPDCRPLYIEAMNNVVHIHNPKMNILAPLMGLSKGQIIKLGDERKIPWHLTWSCHRGKEKSCARCPGCLNRLRGFTEAMILDPLEYDLLV